MKSSKLELKRQLHAMGIKVVKGNYVRKKDIMAAIRKTPYRQCCVCGTYVKADLFAKEADAGLKESLKEFMKKAIVPALMLLGPVACGTQPESDSITHKAEKQAQVKLSEQDIDCDIEIDGDIVTWSFKDVEGDTLTLEHPLGIDDLNRNTLEIIKEPKSERMQNFKEAALDTFSFGFNHMMKKYGCEVEQKKGKLPTTSPALP